MSSPAQDGVDTLFGGHLCLKQPRTGHRVGTDAVLLAAASPVAPGDRFVDVGAGTGAVGLALALRVPDSSGVLLEIDPATAAFAEENCRLNGADPRLRVLAADLFDRAGLRAGGLAPESATLVVTNPPFYPRGTVRASDDRDRARAHVLPAGSRSHSDWIRAALRLLAPQGRFCAIHRPEALPALMEAWEGRLGGVTITPVHARPGAPAIRVLVTGTKGSRAPLRIDASLVLHGTDGRPTPESLALHRGEVSLADAAACASRRFA